MTTRVQDHAGLRRLWKPQGPSLSRAIWNFVRGAERTRGAISYLSILALLHEELRPAHYLEIGVRDGRSLALAGGPATGVDPAPSIKYVLPAKTEIVQMTSDAFFAQAAAHFAPDFCLIDGMHLFEYALRDFIN